MRIFIGAIGVLLVWYFWPSGKVDITSPSYIMGHDEGYQAGFREGSAYVCRQIDSRDAESLAKELRTEGFC